MAEMATIEKTLEALHWLGHDCFRLDGPDGPIYFDPYELPPGQPQASLILASHAHYDHCVAEDVKKLQGPRTVVITEPACAEQLTGDLRIMAPGDELTVGGVSIKAVPAYNLNKQFHPKGNRWLGFVATVDGVSIYHAGDTDFIPEMEGLRPDIALLPVSGTYVMTAAEAAQAARAISPKVAVPMHYGAIVGGPDDAAEFARALDGEIAVRILKKEP